MKNDEFKIETIDNRVIKIPINYSRLGIWENYITYVRKAGFYQDIEKIYGCSNEEWIHRSSLASRMKMDILHQNLTSLIELREKQNSKTFKAVECGTGLGRSAMLISYLLNNGDFRNKTFDAYDTFEGLPPSSRNKGKYKEGSMKGSIEHIKKILKNYNFVYPIKGIIPESLPINDNNSYDFVHIDLDLYEGTYAALKHFVPRLNKNGIVQLDDYNNLPWTGGHEAVDDYMNKKNKVKIYFVAIPLGGAFILRI